MKPTYEELEAKCAALAAENAGLKGAFDKPQAYLSWHAIPPTWEDPLPCGEYLDVHDEAGHKNSDGTDCWPVYAKPEIETPATDAFLAEVRAHDLNAFIQGADSPGGRPMSNIDKLKSAAAKAVDNFDPNMFVETRDVLGLLDELEAAEKRIAELERKEQHSDRQSVIDALASSGEEWSDIEEYMQKWDAERAAAAGKGEAS